MNYDIEMSPKAVKELYEAWEWYEDEQPGLGERFEEEFFRKIGLIRNNPLHYTVKKRPAGDPDRVISLFSGL